MTRAKSLSLATGVAVVLLGGAIAPVQPVQGAEPQLPTSVAPAPSPAPTPAPALRPLPPLAAVRITVQDAISKRTVSTIPPGGTLLLAPGEQVRLKLEAVAKGSGATEPLPARFEPVQPIWGRAFSKPSEERGQVFVVGAPSLAREPVSDVRYTVLRELPPPFAESGSFRIRLLADTPEVQQAARHREALGRVDSLYRGILMRPAEDDAAPRVGALAGQGYRAFAAQAAEIAASAESQALADRGVTAEQRLEALYRHLLRRKPEVATADQRAIDLQVLRSAGIAALVKRLTGTAECCFNQGYGLVDCRAFAPQPTFPK